MTAYCVKAPAKVNLFLHIVGKMDSGYHLLESIFAFIRFSNFLSINIGCKKFKHDYSTVNFVNAKSRISSRYNTVLSSIRMLVRYAPGRTKISVDVIKNIPTAAGLGSGSSDAGAMLRVLGKLWSVNKNTLDEIGLNIGADVVASIDSKVSFVSGMGEKVHNITNANFQKYLVLVKPKSCFLNTRDVFKAYNGNHSQSIEWNDNYNNVDKDIMQIIKDGKNDLQESAIKLAPEIEDVISVLESQKECILTRMSGSGPTCFGIFPSEENANAAVNNIKAQHPHWWVYGTSIID